MPRLDTTTATTEAALTVTIPGVPDYRLSPNARGVSGWTKSRLVAELREHVGWCIRLAWGEHPSIAPENLCPRLSLSFVIAWPTGRRSLDDDNALAVTKAYRDQVAASLGRSSDAGIRTEAVTQQRAEKGDRAGWVRITVRSATKEGHDG